MGFRKGRKDSKKSKSLLILVVMFADYTTSIVQDYQEKKTGNVLPLALIQPTPARLREVCLAVCDERYDRRDERTLKEFFGQGNDKGACMQAIDRCDVDKFRPLVNFLKKSTSTTDVKNIELLAWLIDFKNRPFKLGEKYDVGSPVGPKRGEELPKVGVEKKPVVSKTQPGRSGKIRMAIIAVTILIFVSYGIYRLRVNKPFAPVLTGHEACMYWEDDHYQPISCAQKLENVQVIALDSEMLRHFHKITRPDTITLNAKGSVWYVKYRGKLEFYTSSGFHPIDPQLRLKPITDYMIRKYIHGEQVEDDVRK